MKRISSPIESLMQGKQGGDELLAADYLIVGSGYGGAVAAMRLAGDGDSGPQRKVVMLERGREYGLGDFPYDIDDLPAHVRLVRDTPDGNDSGYSDALFNIHLGSESPQHHNGTGNDTHSLTEPLKKSDPGKVSVTDVLVGSGLGGTSLINANVAEEPQDHVFRKQAWPAFFRNTPKPLKAEFDKVREHLGVATHTSAGGRVFPKYSALKRLGEALSARARPAHIAVTTAPGNNKVGVNQNPCTDCGNCVTGCNVGAKNTLDRNLLPLAKSRGAQIFTGATVLTIEPADKGECRWTVHIRSTVQPKGTVQPETYTIRAHNVILAAGTLGSTEILLRSRKENVLEFSPTLGDKFSTNGDGLVMSYGQEQKVDAIAGAIQKVPAKRVGPTITGIVQTQGLTIEEASIPASMARVFSELVTTGAMLQRLSDRALPRLLRESDHDPLAASMGVAGHCQALLVMGDDRAEGKLGLSARNNRVSISFPEAGDNPALLGADKLFKRQDRKPGLDGGQYVPNPLWQLMPPEAGDVLGELPDGRVLTVHPLGGCAMGDDINRAVVNDAGQVFNPAGDVHEGLYVFDGSIIPAALEVNPFLTIAALAWRNSSLIINRAAQGESTRNTVVPQYSDVGTVPDRPRNHSGSTAFVIQEQLTGKLNKLTPWFRKLDKKQQQRITETEGLVVQIRATNDDAETWLNNPGRDPLSATMELHINPLSAKEVEEWRPVGARSSHLEHYDTYLLTLEGSFTILKEDRYGTIRDYLGGIKAVLTYVIRRGLGDLKFLGNRDPQETWLKSAVKKIRVFYNIGILQSRSRRLRYDFRNRESGVSIRGEKVLGYSFDLERLWNGLLNLNLKIKEGWFRSALATLKVNTDFLLEPGLVEVQESPSLPQSLLFAGGLASFFARSTVMTNFWEFGGLEYLEGEIKQETEPPDLQTNIGAIPAQHYDLFVPVRSDDKQGEKIKLLLTNYHRKNARPVLLLHGLAQGSQIFWTPSIEHNMARYFYEHDFDVWLLDYRLSNHVLPYLNDHDWSMDDIALCDIPMAIDQVYAATGQEIDIVAHCVGSCTLAMALLSIDGLSDKIHGAVTNAIHPWVIASPGNRFRAKLGNFSRDWISGDLLQPVPHESDDAVHRILDRIAFSLSRIREQGDDHPRFGGRALVRGICDRMTFLYGRMWNHRNLSRETHEAFEHMLGPAPAGVYQHLYYYTQLRRITNEAGENAYLESNNILKRWKINILFVHGGDSLVFNPHSARRSAKRLSEILRMPKNVKSSFAGSPQNASPPFVGYEIFPGYGHMDVIFGKNAHEECFPEYVDFLRQPSNVGDPENASDWPEANVAKPRVGPLLRAAWIENGHLRLRISAELRTFMTDVSSGLLVHGASIIQEQEITVPSPPLVQKAHFRCVDVEIEDPEQEIELEIRGDFQRSGQRSGVDLKYHDQAWLRRLRSYPGGAEPRMCFVVGSCRYPGSVVDNAISDKVYKAVEEHTRSEDGAQMLFLTGDQIYADALDQLFEIGSLSTRYIDRYRRAFARQYSPNFASLVQQVPTHFTLDDHEFDDNWSGSPGNVSAADRQQWLYARETAARFMSSVRNQAPVAGQKSSISPFYYALSHPHECDFPTFVTDTRSEREFRDSNEPGDHALFADHQYRALVDWLREAKDQYPLAPKFIISGSIIAPLSVGYCRDSSTWRQQDGWAGYPGTLETLLALIVDEDISNVVFVGGDAHLSAVSRLEVEAGQKSVDIWQIVSSGFYAPMPFANSHIEDHLWNVRHELPTHLPQENLLIHCTNTFLSDGCSQFVRVDASLDQILVTCFDQNNNCLAKKPIPL